MSVDDRLREAFGATDRSWDEQVPDALAALTERRRRETAVRRGAGAGLVAAAAVAVVAATVSQRADQDPSPVDGPTSSPSGTASGSTGPGRATAPLEGTWVSEPITRADVRRVARQAGVPGDASALLAAVPATPFRVVLYVDGGRSSVLAAVRASGHPEKTVDEENLTVSGDRLVMQPMFDTEGENVHTWVLEGDVLRLGFVSTTDSAAEGVPAATWQLLFYDNAAFTPGT